MQQRKTQFLLQVKYGCDVGFAGMNRIYNIFLTRKKERKTQGQEMEEQVLRGLHIPGRENREEAG